MNENELMQKIISLAKRRGFIYQGSEIYGGLAGTYDYGPLGAQLKKNIKDSWWKKFVENRTDMYGLDAAILMNQQVWQTTGHVENFTDPVVECGECNRRFRADQLDDTKECPECKGKLGDERTFNLMLKTQVGASEDSAATSYLRPETAQGIFVNFKNVVDSFSPKLPFGMAQIGKAFRNEITPRDFIFRVREFEQMEIEFFVKEGEWEKYFDYWKEEMLEWMGEIGLDMNKVSELDVAEDDRAHYSKKTIDFEFQYPFGVKELYGLAYRTDYDLKKHAEASKQKLQYLDIEANEWITPHVIEPSFGLDRTILALLVSAYKEEEMEGGVPRVYLDLSPNVAPVKVAVSPLLKNKPELSEKARAIFGDLKAEFGNVMYDDNGNIGKRYRRQDEIGTPYCVVVDFDSLEDGKVTVRDRNTAEQERISMEGLVDYLKAKIA
jgi:glycyl-tRNA synthetase